MRGAAAWLRLDLRRRGRSLVVLALLLAFAGGLVMAVTAGARRNGTALQRLLGPTLPATAVILPNDPTFDWTKVEALPEVASVGLFSLDGMYGVEGLDPGDASFPNANAAIYTTVEKPVILQGRMYDDDAVDEVIATEPFVAKYHKSVGDTVTLRLFSAKQALDSFNGDAVPVDQAAGPKVVARIVGVGRVPWVFQFGGGDGAGVLPTYGFFAKYRSYLEPPGIPVIHNALVRLRHGEADMAAFRADFARVTGRPDVEIASTAEGGAKILNATGFEHDALLLFAFVAAVAALLIVGQAIVRYTASAVVDLDVLRALGLTSRESVLAAVAGPVLAALLAAVVAVPVAVLASSLFPIGVGRTIEPDPGRHADWVVLGVGSLVLVGAVALVSLLAASNALRRRSADAPVRRSSVATLAARLGLPVSVTMGTRLALEPGRGRTSVPVRPALLGAVAGVLGVVAASTFHAGLADAASNPERYGQTYQMGGFLGENGDDGVPKAQLAAALKAVGATPGVTGVVDSRTTPIQVSGHSVTAWELATVSGSVPMVSIEGREPRAADEIALAPTSAKAAGAHVGDRVHVVGGDGTATDMTVTGITFVPDGPHSTYDDGAWVTRTGYAALFPSGFFKFHIVFVRLAPGTNVDAMKATLNAVAPVGWDVPTPPAGVVNLQTVSGLPTLLGVFLALLAVAAIGHALATAVRRRRHDMAVLRAVGLTRPQVRATVAWQATTLAVAGLLFGIPLGVALGRTVWRTVAVGTPVQYAPPLALLVCVLLVPAALLLVNALAAYPGHRAVRQRVGPVLRAE